MRNEQEQSEFCEILDTWYLGCKGQFKGIHPLGNRKEDLKGLVCKWIETKKFEKKKGVIHRQKPCALTGTSRCGEFNEGDLISFDEEKTTCKKCKRIK